VAGDGEQPAPEVAGALQPGIGLERLHPDPLGTVLAVVRAGERVREAGHVAPIGVDQLLERRQDHADETYAVPRL